MRTIVLTFLLLGLSTAASAQDSAQDAADDDDQEVAADSDLVREAVARGEVRPLPDLLARLAADHPGEVLDIEVDLHPDGRIEEYEFEVLTPEGRLIEVDMDAATGEITEVGSEDPDDEDAPDDEDD